MTDQLALDLSARTVKAIRAQLGLSQAQLAKRLGVLVRQLKRWEAGEAAPRAKHQAALAALAAGGRVPEAPVFGGAKGERRVLRIADALQRMGLQNAGGGHVSDRTLRNAIKSGALPAFKVPGYRLQEWRFYEDDFNRWLATGYHAYRDPRGSA